MPAGTIVAPGSLVSPGGQQGIPGPNAVSTDAGNVATFGSDNRLYVPDPTPTIWAARLRSFNALGNPTFEVDQRATGAVVNVPNNVNNSPLIDRWVSSCSTAGAGRISGQQLTALAGTQLAVPGTNFQITNKYLRITCTTVQASIGTGDYIQIGQQIEGPQVRELFYDSTSVSFLVRSSVAPFTFGVAIRDNAPTKSFVHLFTVPTANAATLCTLPNIAVFPSGNFTMNPGVSGILFNIILACGSALFTTPDAWQGGNFLATSGISNFLATSGATFDLIFGQWEPGAACSTLIDYPFRQNYEDCQSYFQKTYDYAVAVGTANTNNGMVGGTNVGATTQIRPGILFPKKMAKTPNLTTYLTGSPATANLIFNVTAGANVGWTTAGVGEGGYALNASAAAAATSTWQWHHVADTGW